MADFIYNPEGHAQGFRVGSVIYDLGGRAVGRVWAERAYRFDGSYVGVLYKNMVVDKPTVSRRNLPPITPPPNVARVHDPDPRRPINHGFEDVFHLLGHGSEDDLEPASQRPASRQDLWDDFF